jgi:hypothetical protein
MLNVFNIYHAVGPEKFTETEDQIRIYVGHVEASSLEMAFNKSQNLEFSWNINDPCRSTSIGDVIESNNKFYMVCATCFKELVEAAEDHATDSVELYDYSAE